MFLAKAELGCRGGGGGGEGRGGGGAGVITDRRFNIWFVNGKQCRDVMLGLMEMLLRGLGHMASVVHTVHRGVCRMWVPWDFPYPATAV